MWGIGQWQSRQNPYLVKTMSISENKDLDIMQAFCFQPDDGGLATNAEYGRAILEGFMSVLTFGYVFSEADHAIDSNRGRKNVFSFLKSDAEAIASDWQEVQSALHQVKYVNND